MTTLTLPTPNSSQRGRRTLLLLVAALLLPFVLGAGLYLSGWHPDRAGNRGELLNPAPSLLDARLQREDGQPLSAADFAGKWTLLLLGQGPCAADCAARIDEMRRIQVSLNKDMVRLRRLVLSDDLGQPAWAAARQVQPDLLLARGTPPLAPGSGYQLYVADPQGRLILRYAPEIPAREVRRDLERLLKFAWNG